MRSLQVRIFGKWGSSEIRPWEIKAEKLHRGSLSKKELSKNLSMEDDSSIDGYSNRFSDRYSTSSSFSDTWMALGEKEHNSQIISSHAEHILYDEQNLPGLVKQATKAVADFEKRARRLLRFQHASHFQKLLFRVKHKFARSRMAAMKEGKNLISYASINANEILNVLQKCEKTKLSIEENKYKKQLQAMRVRFLRSRWLIEVIAFYINSIDSKSVPATPHLAGILSCSFESEEGKYSVSFSLTDSLKIEIDLTCPICLETVFEPVSLGCGHVFCFSCACDAASILPLEGLESACKKSKCPSCRKKGVYVGALHLKGLNILIKNRCKDQWEERRKRERTHRLQQAKEYWNGQLAMIMST
ncbi:hypothetical protein O6H91_01G015900 [Diphasiastrum complanatum]|uniref:Uncharacterized protein n=2 Tax=Diphasiastrum complanatum TaxID=34168 RepID=A0ACC2ENG0_DIPCM|nr:hypothetical protein O6H91_01G015900 [Diphasiastrum complanatum]KAJ7568034.1 hypothetical protein O6H91_01G015900 [Diphasiastrum complanatum]